MANQKTGDDVEVLTSIIDRLQAQADGPSISVDEIVRAFEDRGIGALCAVIGLVAAAPIVGAIPGVSIVTGTLVLLCAAQFVFGRSHIPGSPLFWVSAV
jgi:hypothetical protein